MDLSELLPWRCWVCEGGDFGDEEQKGEVKVPQVKGSGGPLYSGVAVQPTQNSSGSPGILSRVSYTEPIPSTGVPPTGGGGLGGGYGGQAPEPRRLAAAARAAATESEGSSSPLHAVGSPKSAQSPQPSAPAENSSAKERARLRELMQGFVQRGMKGVDCEILDETTGAFRRGSYRIDERLQNLCFVAQDSLDGPANADQTGSEVPKDACDSHTVPFSNVCEVYRAEDLDTQFPQIALPDLSDEQRKQMLFIAYTVSEDPSGLGEAPSPTAHRVCFLEESQADRQRTLTCVRILRRYMDEQKGRQGSS